MDIDDPLLVMAYAKLDYPVVDIVTKIHAVSVEQCMITPCLRHYNLTTKVGIAERVPLNTEYGVIKNYNYPSSNIENPPEVTSCWQPNAQMSVKSEDLVSTAGAYSSNVTQISCSPVLGQYAIGVMDVLSNLYAGTGYILGPGSSGTKPVAPGEGLVLQRVYQTGLKHVIDNMAASITKRALQSSPESVPGYTITNLTYVSVRWEWLILPIVLEVLGLFVLAVAIVVSSRRSVPLWKASVLPLLYHGFEQPETGRVEYISDMEHLAEEKVVRLVPANSSPNLVLRS